jgi:cation transport ATPase
VNEGHQQGRSRYAEIGVAMGGWGIDLAKEAADVIQQDAWFPTIGEAVFIRQRHSAS